MIWFQVILTSFDRWNQSVIKKYENWSHNLPTHDHGFSHLIGLVINWVPYVQAASKSACLEHVCHGDGEACQPQGLGVVGNYDKLLFIGPPGCFSTTGLGRDGKVSCGLSAFQLSLKLDDHNLSLRTLIFNCCRSYQIFDIQSDGG